MKKLIYLLIFSILLLSLTSAWSNTTFNNSLSTENLTFTGSQNITRYLQVPGNNYLTSAYMNLSGYNITNYTNLVKEFRLTPNTNADFDGIYVNESDYILLQVDFTLPNALWFFNKSFVNYKNITLNTDSYSDFFINSTNILTLNNTGITKRDNAGNIISGFNLNTSNSVNRGFYYDNVNYYVTDVGTIDGVYIYNNSGFNTKFYNITNITLGARGIKGNGTSLFIADNTGTEELIEVNYSMSLIKRIDISSLESDPTGIYWNGTEFYITGTSSRFIQLSAINKLTNINISINNNQFYSYLNNFTQSNNRTSNFASYINSYLSSCTYIGGYCNVPITFHSDTAGILQYSSLNFTSEGVVENNVNWSNSSYETKNETFYINISYDPALYTSVTSNLIYDNKTYSGAYNGLFYRKIDLPLVNTPTNKSFYWQFRLVSSSTGDVFQFNSSNYNQTVNPIYFGYCNASLVVNSVNYTVYDEDTLNVINVSTFASTFYYWLGDGTTKDNSSYNITSQAIHKFCINPNQTMNVNPTISLTKSNYFSRTYSFINERFNSTNIERSLYMLNNSLGTNIILEWKDAGLSPIIGDLMKIRRYYPSTNSYLDVHQDLTDNFGVVVGSLIENTVKYKFEFYNSSSSLIQTSEPVTIACRSSICVISFVKEDTTNDFNRFENITNYEYTLIFNNDTNTFIYTWNDNTGNTPHHRLLVEKIAYNGTTIVCNSSSTDIIGSLTCGVSGDGSYRAQIYRHASPERRIDLLNIKVGAPRDFGIEGLLWSFILTMTMIGVGVWNPPIGIGLYVVTMIFLGSIGIVYVSPAIIIAQIALGVAFIWAFRS